MSGGGGRGVVTGAWGIMVPVAWNQGSSPCRRLEQIRDTHNQHPVCTCICHEKLSVQCQKKEGANPGWLFQAFGPHQQGAAQSLMYIHVHWTRSLISYHK